MAGFSYLKVTDTARASPGRPQHCTDYCLLCFRTSESAHKGQLLSGVVEHCKHYALPVTLSVLSLSKMIVNYHAYTCQTTLMWLNAVYTKKCQTGLGKILGHSEESAFTGVMVGLVRGQ